MTKPFCTTCRDTGMRNYVEVFGFLDAVDVLVDCYKTDGYRGVLRSREPEPEGCTECPQCAVCMVEARHHTEKQAAECAAEYTEHGRDVLPVSFEAEPWRWWLPGS